MTGQKRSSQYISDFSDSYNGNEQDFLVQDSPVLPADVVSQLGTIHHSSLAAQRNHKITGQAEFTGNNRNNRLIGTRSDDVIRGRGGNDRLIGRRGADQLFGDDGNDQLAGRQGRDQLVGGSGNDELRGEAQSDRLFGGGGRDRLIGGGASDLLRGGGGNDTLRGGGGRDTLEGTGGDDRLVGNANDDVLVGGDGEDTLNGGGGRDRFVYNSFDEREDEIINFDTDRDRLDFSQLFTGSRYSSSDPLDDYIVIVNDDDERTLIRVDGDGDNGDAPFRSIVALNDIDFDDVGASNFIF